MDFLTALTGIAFVAIGLYFLIYLYAFASMVGPEYSATERNWLIFKKLFSFPEVSGVLVALVPIFSGLYIVFHSLKKIGSAMRRPLN